MTHVSRLAPSPTGALHLGNARTFLINWAIARQRGWTLRMRMEDLDGPRVKHDATEQALGLLTWLGLDWDGPVTMQSDDLTPYREALDRLCEAQRAYQCELTRSEIAAAGSAPHGDDHETAFPRRLRATDPDRFRAGRLDCNYRFVVPDDDIAIDDRFAGPVTITPAREVGDFVIWTRRGVPGYQLAVVVDDARQGVTDVVRGDDLLPSAGRQSMLYRALDQREPNWWHLPLVLGHDGRRLAKRHGDTRLIRYRDEGVDPERVLGLISRWCGIDTETASTASFLQRFDLARVPPGVITFTEEDDRWLRRT